MTLPNAEGEKKQRKLLSILFSLKYLLLIVVAENEGEDKI